MAFQLRRDEIDIDWIGAAVLLDCFVSFDSGCGDIH
jgi:hypothetical protein